LENKNNIPLVKPSQFDTYLFGNWKATVFGLYENFHIEKIENYKEHLVVPTPPHRRSVYFLLFITKGSVIRTKGLNKYQLKQNSCFCLANDQITGIDFVSEDAEGFYVHFLPEIFNHPNLKIDLSKDFPIFSILNEPDFEIRHPEKIQNLMLQLYKDYQKENKDLIPLYLTTLLLEIQNNVQSKQSPTKNAAAILTFRYKHALSEHIYNFKTLSEFADYLSVSPNHLLKCVKQTTGKSARELLDDMRILEAKVLLKQTNLSIGEIAYKIGKYEPSDFARFFKSKTNTQPNSYRNTEK
jgi:AraC family transcriptional activator of pobA